MLTVLFWNIGRRSLADRVARIARGRDADIVLLAECASPAWVTRRLNEQIGGARYFPAATTSRLTIYTRFAPTTFSAISETNYYSIRELQSVTGVRDSLIVVGAHLPSKLEVSDQSQFPDAADLSRAITSAEDRLGHTRTVLLGDLNMNPFEFGASAGAGLHGVMTRDIARTGGRTVLSTAESIASSTTRCGASSETARPDRPAPISTGGPRSNATSGTSSTKL
jgi:hypothetical protein